MKRLIRFAFILLTVASCQKEAKLSGVVSDNPNDSLDSLPLLSKETEGNSTAKPLPQSAGQSSGFVLYHNQKAILEFSPESSRGIFSWAGKTFPITSVTSSENTYEIKGENLAIILEDGAFSDRRENCIEGDFPKLQATLPTGPLTLKEVQVKDCSTN